MYVCLSVCFIFLFISLTICLTTYLPLHPVMLSTSITIYLSIYLSSYYVFSLTNLSICPYIRLATDMYMFASVCVVVSTYTHKTIQLPHLFVHQTTNLSIYISTPSLHHPSLRHFVCPPLHQSIHLSICSIFLPYSKTLHSVLSFHLTVFLALFLSLPSYLPEAPSTSLMLADWSSGHHSPRNVVTVDSLPDAISRSLYLNATLFHFRLTVQHCNSENGLRQYNWR